MADINKGDANHSIIRSFDEATDSLKTTLINAPIDINVSAFTDSIKIGDSTGSTATITTVSGKKGLDVNVLDLAITAANDSIALGDGTDLVGVSTVGLKKGLNVSLINTQESTQETVLIDEVSATLTYFGFATPSSIESNAVWRIKRLQIVSTVTNIKFADGNANYDNTWNNRAALTYS